MIKQCNYILFFISYFFCISIGISQNKENAATDVKESDYYTIQTIPTPEGVKLGIGGMALLPNDKLAVCTRRGEVWIISNPYLKGNLSPSFKLFARGLHEPLGMNYSNGSLYLSQRQELTRIRDLDGDDVADEFKTIYPFEISGNYHEYAYGPILDSDGNMVVTLNLAWVGHMESVVKWRGWMLKITENGEMVPFATGLRSPAGLGLNSEGAIFYSENQGGWIGSGYITALDKGDFASHPAGLNWSGEENSPVKLTKEDIPNTGRPQFEIAKEIKGIKPASVWIPHGLMGVSTSDILLDKNENMGPFKEQLFVGDQGGSLINRVFLEKVNGTYQGVVFPFIEGFSSGVLRLEWGSDGSMFVGMTGRGWGAKGGGVFGLQRLIWNGKVPFETKTIKAKPDGFELEFTKPVDRASARNLNSYHIKKFIYKYHSKYGSPIINESDCSIKAIEISDDGLKVRLVVEGLKEGYIHQIETKGLRSLSENLRVLHPIGYYTLNAIPKGEKLQITETNKVKKLSDIKPKETILKQEQKVQVGKKEKVTLNKVTLEEQVKPLLNKYTCTACHNPDKKIIGPSFSDIAERGYSTDKLIQLIYDPEPKNWPDYATPMPPMSHIPKADVKKIANWISSLSK